MTPQCRGPLPTRYDFEITPGRSLAKNVSVRGPPGMSTHSVSRGGATVGRSITRTIGCMLPALASCQAVVG